MSSEYTAIQIKNEIKKDLENMFSKKYTISTAILRLIHCFKKYGNNISENEFILENRDKLTKIELKKLGI